MMPLGGNIGVDHHLNEFREADCGFPAEPTLRLVRVTDEEVDFSWAEKSWILLHTRRPVDDADSGERNV